MPTACMDTEEACVGKIEGGGAGVVEAARRKIYTCSGGSQSVDDGGELLFCVEPSARGYLNHEFPFGL